MRMIEMNSRRCLRLCVGDINKMKSCEKTAIRVNLRERHTDNIQNDHVQMQTDLRKLYRVVIRMEITITIVTSGEMCASKNDNLNKRKKKGFASVSTVQIHSDLC